MSHSLPVFKSWVPEWLIRIGLLIVVIPGIILFALSSANVGASAGYYGVEPNDVQYSFIIFYAAVASFFVLEGRFFKNIASKQYLLLATIIQIVTSYLCYITHSFALLLIIRFVQGMVNCATITIVLTLIFSRLNSERSKEIGYSVFYCVLLCVAPFTTLVTASIIDAFDFNVVYKCALFSCFPGAALMYVIMNNVRFNRKFPLYQLDWPSFILYGLALSLFGYVMVYGQQYYWLQDGRISGSIIVIFILFTILAIRQLHLKRPYINLNLFRFRNFNISALLLFFFYISRGSLGFTTTYFASVLGLDPIHIGYILIYNIAGIVVSVLISSRLVLLKIPLRRIFLYGFLLLLIFHVRMCFLFDTQADISDFIIPLIIQGLGTGMLMVPIILSMVSSVPAQMGSMASAVGVLVRFVGFSTSIAIVNFFQLYNQNSHINRFQEQLSTLNPVAVQRLAGYKQSMMSHGVSADQAVKISNGLLSKSINVQAQLRSAMDYYQLMSWFLLVLILLIALFPSRKKVVINVVSNQPAPVIF